MPGLKKIAAATVAAAASLCFSMPAWALVVQPVVVNMSTTGNGAIAALTVVNDRDRPSTVEVLVQDLKIPEKGPTTTVPDKGNEFIIVPPFKQIPAGGTQVIRIRWVGNPLLPKSKLYMFAVRELPVNKLKGSGVQIVYSIQELVTVSSPGQKTNVSIVRAFRDTRTVPASQGHPSKTLSGVSVLFHNAGNKVAFASQMNVTVRAKGTNWKVSMGPGEIGKDVGVGVVPPESSRELFFPMKTVPATGTILATASAANSD